MLEQFDMLLGDRQKIPFILFFWKKGISINPLLFIRKNYLNENPCILLSPATALSSSKAITFQ